MKVLNDLKQLDNLKIKHISLEDNGLCKIICYTGEIIKFSFEMDEKNYIKIVFDTKQEIEELIIRNKMVLNNLILLGVINNDEREYFEKRSNEFAFNKEKIDYKFLKECRYNEYLQLKEKFEGGK